MGIWVHENYQRSPRRYLSASEDALLAARGITLKRFFTEALVEQLRNHTNDSRGGEVDPPWMAGFGVLAELSDETRRVLNVIEAEFERLSTEDLS